jgi:carbon monoxide dehydrogenase subunit G
MEMTGEQRIQAPRERVWAALNDPEVLKQCIPGCQTLEKLADDRMRAVALVKVGPIGARFAGEVKLSELDPPNGYRIEGEGQGGPAGFAKGGARVQLTEDGLATRLTYEVAAQIGGRLAQLGGPIIDATAKQMAAAFFRKLSDVVVAPAPAAAGTDAAAGAASATADEVAAVSSAPTAVAPTNRFPIAWILAVVVAALAGHTLGGGDAGSWMSLAIGLLVVVVAAAAFDFGRRSKQTVIAIDPELLARILERLR